MHVPEKTSGDEYLGVAVMSNSYSREIPKKPTKDYGIEGDGDISLQKPPVIPTSKVTRTSFGQKKVPPEGYKRLREDLGKFQLKQPWRRITTCF